MNDYFTCLPKRKRPSTGMVKLMYMLTWAAVVKMCVCDGNQVNLRSNADVTCVTVVDLFIRDTVSSDRMKGS